MSLQSIPYILFVLYFFALTILELSNLTRVKRYIPILSILMMLFFLGLRGLIGSDWSNYYPNFQNLPVIGDSNFKDYVFNSFYEPFFQIYTSLIKSIWDNYFFYTFVNVLIDVIILHVFFKRYSVLYAFSFLIFVVMGGLASEIDLLRNIKSLMLFLLSIQYMEKRKFVKFLALNLLGAMFHVTSLLYIPFYFFARKRFPRGLFILLFVAGTIILVLELKVFSNVIGMIGNALGGPFALMITNYFFDGDYLPQGLTIGFIDRLFFTVLVMTYYNKILRDKDSNVIFVNAFIMYILIFLYTSESNIVSSRFGNLFYFSYWILVPIIYKFFNKKLNRNLFLLYFLIISCYAVGVQRGGALVDQYQNIIFSIDSYEERLLKFREIVE